MSKAHVLILLAVFLVIALLLVTANPLNDHELAIRFFVLQPCGRVHNCGTDGLISLPFLRLVPQRVRDGEPDEERKGKQRQVHHQLPCDTFKMALRESREREKRAIFEKTSLVMNCQALKGNTTYAWLLHHSFSYPFGTLIRRR